MSKKSNQRNQRVQQIVKAAAKEVKKEEKKEVPILELSAEEMVTAIQEAATEDPIGTEKVADTALKVDDRNVSSTEEEKKEGKLQLKASEEYTEAMFLSELQQLGMVETDEDLAKEYYKVFMGKRFENVTIRRSFSDLMISDIKYLFTLVLKTGICKINRSVVNFINIHRSMNNKWESYKGKKETA